MKHTDFGFKYDDDEFQELLEQFRAKAEAMRAWFTLMERLREDSDLKALLGVK